MVERRVWVIRRLSARLHPSRVSRIGAEGRGGAEGAPRARLNPKASTQSFISALTKFGEAVLMISSPVGVFTFNSGKFHASTCDVEYPISSPCPVVIVYNLPSSNISIILWIID